MLGAVISELAAYPMLQLPLHAVPLGRFAAAVQLLGQLKDVSTAGKAELLQELLDGVACSSAKHNNKVVTGKLTAARTHSSV